jgi:magnesium transporter
VEAAAILGELDPGDAGRIRRLAEYDDEVAGGLMRTEFVAFDREATVADVILDLRANAGAYADYDVQYAYVLDAERRLVGVLRLRDLLLSPDDARLDGLMVADPVSVRDTTDLDTLADIYERASFLALPVVDADGELLGVLRRFAVEAALAERSEASHLKSQGIVGGEELRTMPLLRRSRRRLAWLSVNVVLNVVAASVIAMFEETLSAVIALAFFLPIISDMSGCSGSQAVAVSIRELTLGLVRPHELLWVWVREITVGMINGAVLGALVGVVAWMWRGDPDLGLVVGAALAANTMVAVSIGGAIPLLLKRFGVDPALASGPVLTTVTDICGFFFVLGLATLMLSRLT